MTRIRKVMAVKEIDTIKEEVAKNTSAKARRIRKEVRGTGKVSNLKSFGLMLLCLTLT